MDRKILTFVNTLESYKTAIKNLHWSSKNMSEHKLFDDIADTVSDFQDEVSEIEQGLHGQIKKNQLRPKRYQIKNSTQFLNDVINETNAFYKTIGGKEYIGMRSVVETFLGDMDKYKYLLTLCLKEDFKKRYKQRIFEEKVKNVVSEEIRKILR